MNFEEFVLNNSLEPTITPVEISEPPALFFSSSQVIELKAQLALRAFQIATGSVAESNDTLWQAGRQALMDVFVAYQNAVHVSEYAAELATDSTTVNQLLVAVNSAVEIVTAELEGACSKLFLDAKKAMSDQSNENVKATVDTLTDLTNELQKAIGDMGTALDNLTQAVTGTEVDNWSVIEAQFALATP